MVVIIIIIIIIIKTSSAGRRGKNEIVLKLPLQPKSTCATENWKTNSGRQQRLTALLNPSIV